MIHTASACTVLLVVLASGVDAFGLLPNRRGIVGLTSHPTTATTNWWHPTTLGMAKSNNGIIPERRRRHDPSSVLSWSGELLVPEDDNDLSKSVRKIDAHITTRRDGSVINRPASDQSKDYLPYSGREVDYQDPPYMIRRPAQSGSQAAAEGGYIPPQQRALRSPLPPRATVTDGASPGRRRRAPSLYDNRAAASAFANTKASRERRPFEGYMSGSDVENAWGLLSQPDQEVSGRRAPPSSMTTLGPNANDSLRPFPSIRDQLLQENQERQERRQREREQAALKTGDPPRTMARGSSTSQRLASQLDNLQALRASRQQLYQDLQSLSTKDLEEIGLSDEELEEVMAPPTPRAVLDDKARITKIFMDDLSPHALLGASTDEKEKTEKTVGPLGFGDSPSPLPKDGEEDSKDKKGEASADDGLDKATRVKLALQDLSLMCIANELRNEEQVLENREMINRLGGHKDIICVMKEFATNAAVISEALMTLLSISYNNEEAAEMIGYVGGMRLILQAMYQFSENSAIQQSALACIAQLISKENRVNAERLVLAKSPTAADGTESSRQGGLHQVVQAMDLYEENELLQEQACTLLANLVAFGPEYLPYLTDAGAFSQIAKARERHANNEEIQVQGFLALAEWTPE